MYSSALALVSSYLCPGSARRFGLVGSSGCGKTYLARERIIPEIQRQEPKTRIFIFDPEHDFHHKGNLVNSPSEFWKAGLKPGSLVRWENPRLTDYVFEALLNTGNCVLVVDEADEVFSRKNLNNVRWFLAKRGRHSGIGLLWITQTLTEVANPVRKTGIGIVCGHTIGNDVDALKSLYGIVDIPSERHFSYCLNGKHGKLC